MAEQQVASSQLSGTVSTQSTNLPVQQTQFIGREPQVAAIRALLKQPKVRLLTLTGPGGTGKTRLSLQVAETMQSEFADGVYFVALAGISDPSLVAPSIAQVLKVKEVAGQTLLDTLKDYLGSRQILLLLDNFEQVIAAAPIIAQLLTSAPQLKALITSRDALHIYGAREYEVPPLNLPDPHHLAPLDKLSEYEAVALFVERAQAVKSSFALTMENAAAVAEICNRLDGLPLAIELAAARTKFLAPQAIAAMMEGAYGQSSMQLLIGGSGDLPQRQQTLRDSIEWSYNLLNEQEKVLFARLAAFVGSCTIEAAEYVCNADGGLDVLNGIASLVDQSLLKQIEGVGNESRFVMLQTIREYALDQLREREEVDITFERHAEYYTELTEVAQQGLKKEDQMFWLARMDDDYNNVRASLAWGLAHVKTEILLRLVGSLWDYWCIRGYYSEGRGWVKEALAKNSGVTALKAKALKTMGHLSYDQGDYFAARTWHEESLKIWQALGDDEGVSDELNNLGVVAIDQSDYSRAGEMLEQSLAIARKLGRWDTAVVLLNLGAWSTEQGDCTTARLYLDESLEIFREVKDKGGIADVLSTLGEGAIYYGDYALASSFLGESLAIWNELNDKHSIAIVLTYMGNLAYHQNDYKKADALYEESMIIGRDLEDKQGITDALEAFANLAAAQDQADRAARLFGAAEVIREAISASLSVPEREEHEHRVAEAEATLGEGTFAKTWAAGRAMTMTQAIEYALREGGVAQPSS